MLTNRSCPTDESIWVPVAVDAMSRGHMLFDGGISIRGAVSFVKSNPSVFVEYLNSRIGVHNQDPMAPIPERKAVMMFVFAQLDMIVKLCLEPSKVPDHVLFGRQWSENIFFYPVKELIS